VRSFGEKAAPSTLQPEAWTRRRSMPASPTSEERGMPLVLPCASPLATAWATPKAAAPSLYEHITCDLPPGITYFAIRQPNAGDIETIGAHAAMPTGAMF
jgi:hypothetical protein